LLMAITIIGVGLLMAINGAIGQQYPPAGREYQYEGYALPGGISLGPGTNTVAMSISVASQQGSRTYFQVNGFAIMKEGSNVATVYTLSKALPGIMDRSNNEIQIDIGKLQQSIESRGQASMDELYRVLRPSVTTLMVVARVSPQGEQGQRITLQVQSIEVILPDGQANTFSLSQAMSAVVDSAAMRVYAVGFEQLYSLVDSYVLNVQSDYYREVNYNIVEGPSVVVSPPAVYPVLVPIAFPAVWPVYYPVPVPVPIPVVTVKPSPPSVTPTKVPTVSPTKVPTVSPTVSPTKKPTISIVASPTKKPAVSPAASPTKKPIQSPKATLKPSPAATKKPAGGVKPSLRPH
jgi:hypothetical protein